MNKCFKWSLNDQWQTPSNIYNYFINNGFIDFNPLCIDYDNSLNKIFTCDLYCNPPYSNIEPFVDYMINHNLKGYKVVMLLPVRSGTAWFRKILNNSHCSIYFFTQRLHFSDKNSAPFDCMLVYFNLDTVCNKFYFINRNLEVLK